MSPSLPELPEPPVEPARARPVPVPAIEPGRPPLAILVDYDGTIARVDVTDAIVERFVAADLRALAAEAAAGRIGSRRLMAWEVGLFTADPASIVAVAAEQPHDPAFRPFVEHALEAGVPVEVVSDGFGFYIEPALRALGVSLLPVVTARTTFGPDGAAIEFPNGAADCFVCGTCKRNRVLAHQAAGRAVAFVGDGPSDRYAAGYADIVFAKHALEQICIDEGWPFRRWSEFAEIDAWLGRTLAAYRADPASLPAPGSPPLFCGAEVWGPGRFDPPPCASR